MWTRTQLKEKAKRSFRANYWKAVVVALIAGAIAGGFSSFSGASSVSHITTTSSYSQLSFDPNSIKVDVEGADELQKLLDEQGMPSDVHVDIMGDGIDVQLGDPGSNVSISMDGDGPIPMLLPSAALGILLAVIIPLILLAFVVAMVMKALVFNPLEVGAKRFFLRNLNEPALARELPYAFDVNYKNIAETMFFRDLFTFLWGLLLIVPGIVKSYEYRMIPYLLADDPTLTREAAFAQSKQLMDGQKWSTFVLDLSFIGWNLLSALTLGLLSIFYVSPYKKQTDAALYEQLRYIAPSPEGGMYDGFAGGGAGGSSMAIPASELPVPPFAQQAPAPTDAAETGAGGAAFAEKGPEQ